MRGSVLLSFVLSVSSLGACNRADDKSEVSNTAPEQSHAGSGSGGVRKQQIAPPFDLKAPPADATKTASGLVFKKLVSNPAGVAPKRNDTVLITYTGWKQATGETFFTNQGRGTPMPLNLSQTAPGFTEALQQLRTGEKAVLWMPPEIGYKAAPADGKRETLVYEVTVAEVQPAPAIPDDVGQAPATATALKSGTKFAIIRPGTGKENARMYDSVTYNLTAWDSEGKMLETTERARHPLTVQPYKASTGLAEMLTNLSVGARGRFWIDAEKMAGNGGKPPGGVDKGTLTYEVEITQLTRTEHEPPPTPPDVAKPPADAKKTAKGVFYRLLAKGPGKDPRHPTENDSVKVNYAGWTTDGKMFDSSYLRNEAATFSLHGVIAGWTDGIPLMTPGDKMRFWIPVEMAYKGAPGKPAGMLVFDVELLEIVPPTAH